MTDYSIDQNGIPYRILAPATEHDAGERETDDIIDRDITEREAIETIKRIALMCECAQQGARPCGVCGLQGRE